MRKVISWILCFVLIISSSQPVLALYGTDEYEEGEEKDYFANIWGWDPFLIDYDLEEWEIDGRTIQRGSDYRSAYYYDILKTTKEYLHIYDTRAGGSSIAAVALREYQLCEEEVASGIWNQRAEKNGDNNVIYNTWYYGHAVSGDSAQWCCVFVMYCADKCGYLESGLFPKTAGCTPLYNYFVNQGYESYSITSCAPFSNGYTPVPGDLMFFDNGSEKEHIGIVVEINEEENSLTVVEGNSSNRVMKNEYNTSRFAGYMAARNAKIVHIPYPVVSGAEGIYNFLISSGYSHEGVCAILAAMANETGWTFESDLEEAVYREGYGLCQWTGTRRTDLMNWCSSNSYDYTTAEGQLNFLLYEIEEDPYYSRCHDALMGTDLYTAMNQFFRIHQGGGTFHSVDWFVRTEFNYAKKISDMISSNDWSFDIGDHSEEAG